VIGLVYRLHRDAEFRVELAGCVATVLYGNGKHEDIVVAPVMDDWQPATLNTRL
jgi:hypothetical protein